MGLVTEVAALDCSITSEYHEYDGGDYEYDNDHDDREY